MLYGSKLSWYDKSIVDQKIRCSMHIKENDISYLVESGILNKRKQSNEYLEMITHVDR